MDGLALELAKKLEMKPARYAVRKTMMKALFISPGRYEFNANLFMDQVPRRVTMGLVANSDYVGNIKRSPFNFQHFNVRELSVVANGRSYPQAPYDIDYENWKFVRPFNDTQEALGFANSTYGNGIDYFSFLHTHCIYVFNMTNSGDDHGGLFDLIKKGCTAVNIKFKKPVPDGGITLIVMEQCQNLLLLNALVVFFIEELLREPYNELSPPQKSAKDYVRKLDSEIEHVPKFQWVKNKSRFVIEDVPADPEGLLIGIFQHCMDEAIGDSRLRGVEPTHLGCIISSQLLTSDIWIPIRQMTPDTINTILNRFNDVAQSKKQDGVTLWGDAFTVIVTTVNRNGLPGKRQLKGGAARKLAPVHHRIHEQCLIKIKNFNGDNYCLFYAMQATMVRAVGAMTRQQFYAYLNGIDGMRGKLRTETTEMMEATQAPLGQPNYDAEIYVPRIVDWWNNEKVCGPVESLKHSSLEQRGITSRFSNTGQRNMLSQ
ncbi:hypothetical protein niasHS_000772 [Heterodera schachtii]|uniref:Uncharacterized protein n=1 Tax=Heterodera schachtii TaxID=97005 RepID=A0ABD2KKX6_HETSC